MGLRHPGAAHREPRNPNQWLHWPHASSIPGNACAGGAISAPTAAATPVPGPTITDLEFALCTISLAVADEDRDDLMTGNEYVLFLNDRFLDDLYVDQPFTAIDEIFVTSFNGFVAPSGTIDISGVQPGDARTPAQNTALRAICVDSYQVAAIFLSNSRTPTKSPIAATSPPTMVPTSQPTLSLDPADFQQCRAALLLADSDSDDLDDSDDSDSDRERRLVTRKSAISTVPAKQPGEKRVSMHSS